MNTNQEKLLREFVRKTFVRQMLQEQKKSFLQEQQVRKFVRSLIKETVEEKKYNLISEAKDMANPHPSTGINKLRDSIRKAKPSIKTKFQQLTTSSEQRESFTNHLLAAFVRLFDQLDALSASSEAEQGLEDTSADLAGLAEPSGDEMQAPPDDALSDIGGDIEGLLENLLREIDIDIEDEDQDKLASDQWKKLKDSNDLEEIIDDLYGAIENFEDEDNITAVQYKNMGFNKKGLRSLITGLELGSDPGKFNDVVTKDLESEKEKQKNLSQAEKDFEKKQAQDAERREFGAGLEGDSTGRNQAFDAFNLVQSYFSDNYLDLDSTDDREMFKKWGLYNLKLLLDSYEEELSPQLTAPDIQNPT